MSDWRRTLADRKEAGGLPAPPELPPIAGARLYLASAFGYSAEAAVVLLPSGDEWVRGGAAITSPPTIADPGGNLFRYPPDLALAGQLPSDLSGGIGFGVSNMDGTERWSVLGQWDPARYSEDDPAALIDWQEPTIVGEDLTLDPEAGFIVSTAGGVFIGWCQAYGNND